MLTKVALEFFLLDRESRRLSESTIDFYTRMISPFIDWCSGQGITELDDVTANHIRAYLITFEKRGLSKRTQHAVARGLRAWFNFLIDEEWITSSPMKKVAMPTVDKKILDALSIYEMKALLKACDNSRDEAIIRCLIDTGARASEFISWNYEDIDTRTGAVLIRSGKGDKARQVYLGTKARKSLTRYLMSLKVGAKDPVWVSTMTGNRLTRNGLLQIIKRVGDRAGVKCGPHTLRRTFAIWSLRSGMNIYVLQRLMGHSDLSTLQKYLKLVETDGAEASSKYGVGDSML